MTEVSEQDDQFHLPTGDEPFWTETCWFSFDQPERNLSGTFYPVFRPNLGVASLTVTLWDADAIEPWRARYHRSLWHLAMPKDELTDLVLGGLHYQMLDPLERYRVQYEDGDLLRVELEYQGLVQPHGVGIGGGRGHLDQPCSVRGEVVLAGEKIEIDCLAMRDRTWHVRDDLKSTRSSYSYGLVSERDGFMAMARHHEGADVVIAGFLLRDGKKADLVRGLRRVDRNSAGWPERVEIEATDALGRELHARGRCRSRLASQATPGMFAWMSFSEWEIVDGDSTLRGFGEDQDIRSPDQLRSE
ncbi:MAG: hypothetical protein GY725_08150 [bacterium]|nr:hypothetical protein [bacterium]